MKTALTSFISGIVFAFGLGISGMTRPIKVIGFLDFFGDWDASLGFVMLGAIGVYFVAYRLSRKMAAPILGPVFSIPKRTDLDVRSEADFFSADDCQESNGRVIAHFHALAADHRTEPD